MSGQTIEIIISPDGKATVQTRGSTGPSCREASRFVEEALGQRTGERLTAEFYQAQTVDQQARQQS